MGKTSNIQEFGKMNTKDDENWAKNILASTGMDQNKDGHILPKPCTAGGEHAWDCRCRKCGMKRFYNPDATMYRRRRTCLGLSMPEMRHETLL
jgi:hypothetical protein